MGENELAGSARCTARRRRDRLKPELRTARCADRTPQRGVPTIQKLTHYEAGSFSVAGHICILLFPGFHFPLRRYMELTFVRRVA
jgi:hypothetical protein